MEFLVGSMLNEDLPLEGRAACIKSYVATLYAFRALLTLGITVEPEPANMVAYLMGRPCGPRVVSVARTHSCLLRFLRSFHAAVGCAGYMDIHPIQEISPQGHLSDGDVTALASYLESFLEKETREEVAVPRVLSARDDFEVLQARPTEGAAELRQLYKRRSREVHPDRNRHPLSHRAFQRVGAAVSTLLRNTEA